MPRNRWRTAQSPQGDETSTGTSVEWIMEDKVAMASDNEQRSRDAAMLVMYIASPKTSERASSGCESSSPC